MNTEGNSLEGMKLTIPFPQIKYESNNSSDEGNQRQNQMSLKEEPMNALENDISVLKQAEQSESEAISQSGLQLNLNKHFFFQIQIPVYNLLKNEKNFDSKFLNSMIRLMIKHGIVFNASNIINDENETSVNIIDNSAINNAKSSVQEKNNDTEQVKNEESKKGRSYKKFSQNEDQILKNIVELFGAKNWRFIASMIPNKTPRQCRDRYVNYLSPDIIHSKWSSDEDKLLVEKYNEIGPCWSKLQQYFPSRTANAIKNRYKYSICKLQNSKKKNRNQEQRDLQFDDEPQMKNDINQFQDYENSEEEEMGGFFDSNLDLDQIYFDL